MSLSIGSRRLNFSSSYAEVVYVKDIKIFLLIAGKIHRLINARRRLITSL